MYLARRLTPLPARHLESWEPNSLMIGIFSHGFGHPHAFARRIYPILERSKAQLVNFAPQGSPKPQVGVTLVTPYHR